MESARHWAPVRFWPSGSLEVPDDGVELAGFLEVVVEIAGDGLFGFAEAGGGGLQILEGEFGDLFFFLEDLHGTDSC